MEVEVDKADHLVLQQPLEPLQDIHNVPLPPIGVIAGSSLLNSDIFKGLKSFTVSTHLGDVLLWKTEEGSNFNRQIYFCQRHKADPKGEYTCPSLINKRAIAVAFQQLKVPFVIGFGSVGGMNPSFHPGTLVIPDDYVNFWSIISIRYDFESSFVPGYDSELRSKIISILKEEEIRFNDGGVYVQTIGPRFETKAEIRILSTFGDIVGMTSADEATLMKEVSIPYASICMVDNFANGINHDKKLEVKEFTEGVHRNLQFVENVAKLMIEKL